MLWSPGRSLILVPTLLCLTLVGCGGAQDPLVARAETICEQVMQQDLNFGKYGLAVAARSSSPFATRRRIEALSSGNYAMALEAAKGMVLHPDPAFEPALREVFDTKQGALRLAAAQALAEAGDSAALEWLSGQLDQAVGETRRRALVFLATHGKQDQAQAEIGKLMASEDRGARDEAYAMLGLIREPWATRLLMQGLSHEHGEGRQPVIAALGKTGDASVTSELARFVNTRGLVFTTIEALGELGNPAAEPALRKMLKNKEPLAQVYAGTALWKLGLLENPEEALTPLVSNPDARTRQQLAEQLTAIDASSAAAMLTTLAGDDDEAVRGAAVLGLARRGAKEPLLERIADPAYAVSTTAIEALGDIAGADVLARLEPLLEDENPYVVISAAQAILEIKHRTDAGG